MDKWLIEMNMSGWGLYQVLYWNTTNLKWGDKLDATQFDTEALAKAARTTPTCEVKLYEV